MPMERVRQVVEMDELGVYHTGDPTIVREELRPAPLTQASLAEAQRLYNLSPQLYRSSTSPSDRTTGRLSASPPTSQQNTMYFPTAVAGPSVQTHVHGRESRGAHFTSSSPGLTPPSAELFTWIVVRFLLLLRSLSNFSPPPPPGRACA